jgi:hypothetical protein
LAVKAGGAGLAQQGAIQYWLRMAIDELLIRHVPEDQAVATALVAALKSFGFVAHASTQNQKYDAVPWVVLWSPTTAVDDDFAWECAEAARDSGNATGFDEVYVVAIGQVRSRPAFPEFGRPPLPRQRLRGSLVCDLSGWDGDPADERLAPLIFELPPPALTPEHLPFSVPANFGDMHWRAARASENLATMAGALTLGIAGNAHFVSEAQAAKINELRAHARKPAAWDRFGPSARAAAEAGPEVLHAWGSELKQAWHLKDVADEYAVLRPHQADNLLFAVDVCVGDGFKQLSWRTHRSLEEVLILARKGDTAALEACARGSELISHAANILEDQIKRGNAAAMYAAGTSYREPEYRRRLLLERAGKLGHAKSWQALGSELERHGKHRDAVQAWRKGAELGDWLCQFQLAQALDAGRYARRNAREAYAYFEKAADHEPQARIRLAQMLWDGDGVAPDRARAVHSFFHICLMDGGAYQPLIYIGDLYRGGLGGMAMDVAEARSWYEAAMCANYDVVRVVAGIRLQSMGISHPDAEQINDLDNEDRKAAVNYWVPKA